MRRRYALLAAATAVCVGAVSMTALAASHSAAQGVVRVEGKTWLRDGQPWYPHGFNMVALATPQKCIDEGKHQGWAKLARDTFAAHGEAELLRVRDTWHANTVRFQVSHPGLDPQHRYYDGGRYLQWVKDGVALARRLGLTVILSMQDQVAACGQVSPQPKAQTVRDWQTLAPVYKNDLGVLYELFNEPQNEPTTDGWKRWRNGSADGSVVGHQKLVDTIRATGARNVLLADGARYAERFEGMWPYRLADPVGQLAYATHPYWFHFKAGNTWQQDAVGWQNRFAYLQDKGAPVIVTEWNAHSNACTAGMPAVVDPFLRWLRDRGIGITAHAFDVRTTMVSDLHPNWTPTKLDGSGCRDGAPIVGPDAGANIQRFYAGVP